MMLVIARFLVRIASVIVPKPLRDRFVREWMGELHHEAKHGTAGGIRLVKHATGAFPAARHWRLLEREPAGARPAGFLMDLRVATRSLARSRAYTAACAATLGVGLGGTTAMFTLVDRILLDPLPYPEAGRLVSLSNAVPSVSDQPWAMSTAQHVFYSEHVESLDGIALYHGSGSNLETPDGTVRTFGWRTTSSLFTLTGARARIGRLLDPGDDLPGSPPVVVLSESFWESSFGSDPRVLGRTLNIGGQPVEVVGVLEDDLTLPYTPTGSTAAYWGPLQIDPNGRFANSHTYPMIARLAPGATLALAEREIRALKPRLPERFPQAYSQSFFDRYGFDTRIEPLKDRVVGGVARNLWTVLGAMAVVLLLAAVNVANLTAVRLETRERELAIRSAVGAGRGLVLRYLLAESAVLVAIAAALASGVAALGLEILLRTGPATIPRLANVTLGLPSLLLAIALSATLVMALTAYAATRTPHLSSAALLGTRQSSGSGGSRKRARSVLVVAQVALALALVAWSGLLARSLGYLTSRDPGVNPDGLTVARLHLTTGRYQNDQEIWGAYRDMLTRARAIPGIGDAGMAQAVPLVGGFGCVIQGFEDEAVYARLEAAGQTPCAAESATTPGYFETAGIPILQGRDFTDLDNDAPGTGAVIVSRAFADWFWPGEDPIGKGVAPRGRTVGPFHHVIGVAADVAGGDLEGETPLAIYYPIRQHAGVEGNWGWQPTSMSLAFRVEGELSTEVVSRIRAAIGEVDGTAAVSGVTTFDALVRQDTDRLRFTTYLLVVAAGLALFLATVGLYGVISYLVTHRTREIGLRIAIGAGPDQVRGRFVRQSLALTLAGLAIGVVTAALGGRALEGLLHGVTAYDPPALLGACLVLTAVTLAASWIPARRASRLDPMEALRGD